MSGLIFSLLLAPDLIAALTRVLENLKFRQISKDRGWRGYIEEDRYRVEVFVKRDEKQIQFILPDLSIPKDVCKKAVKNLTAELYARIPGEELPYDNINIVGPSHTFCHYCLEPARGLLFKCKRCGGFYCSEHRFPEEHDCPGGEAAEIGTKQRAEEKKKEEKAKKILLKEIPCG